MNLNKKKKRELQRREKIVIIKIFIYEKCFDMENRWKYGEISLDSEIL